MSFFWKGILFGLLVTMPIGPLAILCIQRTLQYGRVSGLVSGLGAVVADAIYASLAAFGLTFVSNFAVAGQFWLRLLGGAILLYFGAKTYMAKVNDSMRASHTTFLNDFLSTFILMMTNPTTILGFLVLFASFGLSRIEDNYWNSTALVLGVIFGTAIGWVVLCEAVYFFRGKMNAQVMRWINRIAGILIILFGVIAWVSLVV